MKDSKESASAAALIAPIEALIEYHEKYAKSHVSSKWIYGENMMVVQAYKKVLQMIETLREPGADTGTTPPPDVWTCEACGYKSDDIGEYREVCGKCFSAAAERGTTPPEGLEIRDDEFQALYTKVCLRLNDLVNWRPERVARITVEEMLVYLGEKRAATQRAPVEQGRDELQELKLSSEGGRSGSSHPVTLLSSPSPASADHAREGALPTVDEIAEAMADARLWAGAWEQMCEAERNVMRQGAEGVYKLLEARR